MPAKAASVHTSKLEKPAQNPNQKPVSVLISRIPRKFQKPA
jgi:hypothetical protein